MRLSLASALLLCLCATAAVASRKKETKTYTVKTPHGPVTVTEEKVTEVTSGGGGSEFYKDAAWGSGAKAILGKSKFSDVSLSDIAGSLVIVVDQTTVTKGLKKYLLEAVKKFPVGTKGLQVSFIEYLDKPYTVVSLRDGWSLRRVMKRVDRQLLLRRRLKKGTKIYDYVGMQAAYNELQKYGKVTAPRIVLMVTSGADSNPSKTKQWRQKLMKEWISLSEINIRTIYEGFKPAGTGGGSVTHKTGHSALLAKLIKTYAAATVKYYKKIYGEVWEFYIMMKHFKKSNPGSWQIHLKGWFKTKYGSLAKFTKYLSRTNSKVGTISPELSMKLLYKKRYGKKWHHYFLIWKYKKMYGKKWRVHYKQHQLKLKHGKWWILEWKKYVYKKKYAKKWQPHYKKWYYKKYMGTKWRYSWMQWSLRNKHGSKKSKYIQKFMLWYFKHTNKSKADKLYKDWVKRHKGMNAKELLVHFRWFYYNLIFDKRKAVLRYHRWLLMRKYGKAYKPKYAAWLAKILHKGKWKLAYKKYQLRHKYGTKWEVQFFKLKYKKNWLIHYKKKQLRKEFGAKWVVPYYRWYFYYKYKGTTANSKYRSWYIKYQRKQYKKLYGSKWRVLFKKWFIKWNKSTKPTNAKKPHTQSWYRKHYGKKWLYYYTRVVYRRRFGLRWRIKFNRWVKKVWKKTRPTGKGVVIHAKSWYRKHYGKNWLFFYTRIVYRRRFGLRWRIKFNRWVKKVWKESKGAGKSLSSLSWFRRKYGKNWRFYFTRALYRLLYGKKWKLRFRIWKRTVWKKRKVTGRTIRPLSWYRNKYGKKWKFFFTKVVYRRRYGKKWRAKFNHWKKTVWRKSGRTAGTIDRSKPRSLHWGYTRKGKSLSFG